MAGYFSWTLLFLVQSWMRPLLIEPRSGRVCVYAGARPRLGGGMFFRACGSAVRCRATGFGNAC